MMDMRAFSKGYWSYFERAQERYGIRYMRCRISAVHEDPRPRSVAANTRTKTASGKTKRFDLVGAVGRHGNLRSRAQLGRRLGDRAGRVRFLPYSAVQPGRDQPAGHLMRRARSASRRTSPNRSWRRAGRPQRRRHAGRVTLYADHDCRNIQRSGTSAAKKRAHRRVRLPLRDRTSAGIWMCPAWRSTRLGLPGVSHAEANLYTCSQDSIRTSPRRSRSTNSTAWWSPAARR